MCVIEKDKKKKMENTQSRCCTEKKKIVNLVVQDGALTPIRNVYVIANKYRLKKKIIS